ncbi:MAG: undecaprenyl-diphosphate phosphatase [Treponema sp.]|nr:undecaprenyl-diphosphate phosphatase [Treponema sp.]
MNILEAIVLGIVQGLTEFLPVSSSGHLVLLQKIFDVKEPSLFFDTMLHFGTLIAVFAVLWKDIWELLKKPVQKLTGFLVLATIPAVVAALLFKDSIENLFISAKFLGFCFLITSGLLVAAELLSRRAKNKIEDSGKELKNAESMTWFDALFIGIMQALAIPPGISRSGATISGALFRNLNRDFAARFSFLLSIPAILGALVLQARDLVRGSHLEDGGNEHSIGAIAIIAGTLTAAAVGFFAIRFMLKLIREKSLFGFAIYTGVLGLLTIIDQFILRIVF